MDERIISLVALRQEEGIRLLQEKYGCMVRYIVGGILKDDRDIDECISDIYMKVWNGIESYDASRGRLPTWLTAIARNTAINRMRRKSDGAGGMDDRIAGEALTPEELMLRQERKEQLSKAVSRLTTQERSIFYRKYYYLQSTAQVAAELGMSERAVEGRLYRLRKKLRSEMGGEGS